MVTREPNIIAEHLLMHFKLCALDSSITNDSLKVNFESNFSRYICDMPWGFVVNGELVDSCVRKLKFGKAAGCAGLITEHPAFEHPFTVILLSLLFTILINYDVLPTDFERGVIFPIV